MAEADHDRLIDLIKRSAANHAYFFDRADDPAWLPVLLGAGFFHEPPPPERGEDWVRFPGWSESRYLARVASKAPDLVLDIAIRIPDTRNVRVHEDLWAIAAELPPKSAARLARREAKWLRSYEGHLMSLPSAASRLFVHLVEGKEESAAYRLAGALLRIERVERPNRSRDSAVALTSEWSYRQVVEDAWPTLMASNANTAFGFLCDRLNDVIAVEFEDRDGFDPTQVWRPSVATSTRNVDGSLFDLLVDFVRDFGLSEAQSAPGLRRVLLALRRYDESLFRRIALHIIEKRGAAEDQAEALEDAVHLNDPRVWPEYSQLLEVAYRSTSEQRKAGLLARLMTEPDRIKSAGEDQRARWRWSRLLPIRHELVGGAREEYDALAARFGDEQTLTVPSAGAYWSGPSSPFDDEALKELSPGAVIDLIRGWTPPGGAEAPTPEGLGRTLARVASANPVGFGSLGDAALGLEPTYVRALLTGFTEAVKQKGKLPWRSILPLCEWTVSQTRSVLDESRSWDRDEHWGPARKQIAELLQRGFVAGDSTIPIELTAEVWSLLERLTEDPDPTLAHEEEFGGDNMDPLTLSINTTRGEALHAVVQYAFWRERALSGANGFSGMASLPEVSRLLDRHLDPAVDPAISTRAVYGRWFAQFIRMDPAWAAAIEPCVFPRSEDDATRFDAAWHAYITHTPAWVDAFRVLREAYAHAIGRGLSKADAEDDDGRRLGDHLFRFRILGQIELSEDDLFARFWVSAAEKLQKGVLEHVGWSLEQTTDELGDEVLGRFRDTWEWVRLHGESVGAFNSLAGFGTWVAATQFDGRWRTRQGLNVLRAGVHLEPSFVVFRALPALVESDPAGVMEIIRRMVLTDPEGWAVSGNESEIATAVEFALNRGDPEASSQARELAELLLARGFASFRGLLD